MKKLTILYLFGVLILSGCYKEQRLADDLKGNWEITDLEWANGAVTEIGNDKHKIEFFDCEKAYTSTCGGVYFLDYADTTRTDLRDTFQYDIKDDELAVTNVKVTTGTNQFIIRFLRQRFNINQLDENVLQLNRIKTFSDSTQGFLRATKL
ncbi:MAG: hypothetical protein WED33_00085 [Bacteroidia bacterium]